MIVDPLTEFARLRGLAPEKLISLALCDKSTISKDESSDIHQTFLDAAESGSPYAMCICSRFYAKGWGAKKSDDKAFYWAKQAANADFAPGYYELGKCYEFGISVAINIDTALECYEKASEFGYGAASRHLALLLQSKVKGNSDAKKIIQLLKLGYKQGVLGSAFELGVLYEEGQVVKKNDEEAFMWFRDTLIYSTAAI